MNCLDLCSQAGGGFSPHGGGAFGAAALGGQYGQPARHARAASAGAVREYDPNVATVYDLRFPRIFIALFGGAATAVAGVLLLQAVMKNPLADPGIIGISSGASLAAVLVTAFFPALYFFTPLFAFLGGMLAFALVYSLSWKGGLSPLRIILVGVAVNAMFTGLMSAFNSGTGSNYSGVASIVNANITQKTWDDFRTLALYAAIGLIASLFVTGQCNLLALEDKTARGLGVNVTRSRIIISVIAVALASISTAIIGPISFLGLIVPHIARLLVGSGHRVLVPYSVLLGAFTLLLADTLGRTIAAPYEISAAVVMSVVGGPFFILLLRGRSKAMADSIFTLENLSFAYGRHEVIRSLDLTLREGKITTLIGANGCGKSTLFSLMTKNLRPDGGRILLRGQDIAGMKLRVRAAGRDRPPVQHRPGRPLGRKARRLRAHALSHDGALPDPAADEEKIRWALGITNTEKLRDKPVAELSGGQKQRVWIAMALAQDTKVLFLDEPTTYLDIRYQLQILRLIRRLNREFGITIIMVLHDINQSLYYSDEIVAMQDGRIRAQGLPEQIITPELVRSVYDVELEIREVDGKPFVIPV